MHKLKDSFEWDATCSRVIDGDTIEIEFKVHPFLEQTAKDSVRFWGCNTPEDEGDTKEAGDRAKARVKELIEGKAVKISADSREKYGRILGHVILEDGRNLGTILINEGLAVPYFGGKR